MSKEPFYVFSYGSNLLFERIHARIHSVEVISTFPLDRFRLVFNKKGVDGSAKANIEETGNARDRVWGVIHAMDYQKKPILDMHETLGRGYQLICFRQKINGSLKVIHTYIVNEDRYIMSGKPFHWYLKFVIAGAKQNDFPESYIAKLASIDTKFDRDQYRRARNEDILRRAGELYKSAG
jgi:hypothetical protein